MQHHIMDNLPVLLAAVQNGLQPEFVFFWGPEPQRAGSIGNECLSQWYPAPFTVDGVLYPTAEHYMMAEKARLFGDEETRQKILATTDPQQAKNLGRLVKGFTVDTWKRPSIAIVERGNLAKFGQHAALKAFLLQTGSAVLAEASPFDKIWGIGFAEDDPRARDPRQWQGFNQLGFALMAVRAKLAGDF